jgi:osmotically-inducible protein OsmY
MNIKLLSILSALFLATSCAITDGKETTKQYAKDTAITMDIKTTFAQDPKLKSRDIGVKTLNGAVQLSGFVSSKKEVIRAGIEALRIKGVKSVHNNLIVQSN